MKIAILGSGAWATALAQVLDDNGHRVFLYGIESEQVLDINKNHQNIKYFGEKIFLSPSIKASVDLPRTLKGARYVLISVPAGAVRSLLNEVKKYLTNKVVFINTAKGFDQNNKRMSEVINEVIPEQYRYPVVSIIGPSHAEEVILRHLTLVTATSVSPSQSRKVAHLFTNRYFRVYMQTDEVGAEIGVAMKNVIAIASGILEGLKLGDNARAALVTRGLSEMARLGKAYGGKMKTYLGLAGLGDLVVTAYSIHSRNFKAGLAIGEADDAASFLATNKVTVEGIRACKTVLEMAKEKGVEVPIVEAVYEVIYNNVKPSSIVENLMTRPIKKE